jgi:hypothetical protein
MRCETPPTESILTRFRRITRCPLRFHYAFVLLWQPVGESMIFIRRAQVHNPTISFWDMFRRGYYFTTVKAGLQASPGSIVRLGSLLDNATHFLDNAEYRKRLGLPCDIHADSSNLCGQPGHPA